MVFRFLVAVLLVCSGFPAAAHACTCSQSAPGKCAGLPHGGVVFLGTVTGGYVVPASAASGAQASADTPATANSRPDGSTPLLIRYHFRVNERFSGPNVSRIDIFSGGEDGDCGYRFKNGAQYLVFTHEGADGRLYSTICDGTRPAADARALIPQLRAMRDGQHVASVFGIVRRVDPPFLDPPGVSDPPVADVTVHLHSRWDRFETGTDAEGVYSLYDVHAGTYRFSAHLPARMELTERNLAIGLRPFTIPAGACYEYDVDALPNGEIRGSVLGPDGKRLPVASVELYRAVDYSAHRPGLWGFQGSKGYFDFGHVGPGRYVLVFNRADRLDPNSPYPRTFYPGVAEASEAKPIVLKNGERLLNLKMKVLQGPRTRRLRVRVRWNGRRPLGTVTVMAQAGRGDNPAAHLIGPDLYEFTLLDSARYSVSAWQDLVPQHISVHRSALARGGASSCAAPARISTPPVAVSAARAPVEQITLTFPPVECGTMNR